MNKQAHGLFRGGERQAAPHGLGQRVDGGHGVPVLGVVAGDTHERAGHAPANGPGLPAGQCGAHASGGGA